jgi:hypothetical protein
MSSFSYSETCRAELIPIGFRTQGRRNAVWLPHSFAEVVLRLFEDFLNAVVVDPGDRPDVII